MPIKQALIFAVATLAFVTAMAAVSPLFLLALLFVGLCGLWAAVRMPPFWRYARSRPDPAALAGLYALRTNFPHHEEFTLQLQPDGTFYCRRFPLFTVWPPLKIEHALSGYGRWSVKQEGRAEWILTLLMEETAPVYVPGDPESLKGGPDIDHIEASFRLGRRSGGFALLTWVGGYINGQTVEFEQQFEPASSQIAAGTQI
jgi:hypothetical protein